MRLVAIIALLLVPVAASAAPPIRAVAFDRLPAMLRAGETVELSWRAPQGARELEILLYLSPGSRTAFRVTAECDPSTGRARWRVPELPAEQAHLVLRWGDAHGEFRGPESPPFRIVTERRAGGDGAGAAAGALVREGPWAGGDPAGVPARRLDSGAQLGPGAEGAPAVETSARWAAPSRASQPVAATTARGLVARGVTAGGRSRAPEVIPQRN